MADLSRLRNISEKDRKMLAEVEVMLGPEPSEMGFVKNLFWGRLRNALVFPYPEQDRRERARCDKLLERLDAYLRDEHPAVQIDREEEIPDWVIRRLFDLGVLGMTIPEEYGGLGMSVTSYNRVLERIGRTCASTAVVVSAHQSIGCKAVMLFGTDEQKRRWLPGMATKQLSAFCLSEPNVGCDAGGQETRCELSDDGTHYILNGEKKWSTSAALSGLFTVMANQRLTDPSTGKTADRVTALVCTPDMEGIDIFEKNRSKCGIRGTWQARIRLTNVKVPCENLLHKEGKGLTVALSCLNYGRCTLSAGMLGSAKRCMDQGIKWSQTRYQFGRPLAAFDLVQERVARMAAHTYAMDAMLYLTTAMLDRHDEDIMIETALCKVFNSEMGWRVVNDAMQIMGGEGYMTENEVERAMRDARINLVVEGANEVMHTFVFGYGGKQLAEQMVGVKEALLPDAEQTISANLRRMLRNAVRPRVVKTATGLGAELFLGRKPKKPTAPTVHWFLQDYANRLAELVQEHSHQFKLVSRRFMEEILNNQMMQRRLSENAMWLHAMVCTISKLDSQIKAGDSGPAFERDRAAAIYFLEMAEIEIRENIDRMTRNADEKMREAAKAALEHNDTLPTGDFVVPERSPNAMGRGRKPESRGVRQFPGDEAKEPSARDRVTRG